MFPYGDPRPSAHPATVDAVGLAVLAAAIAWTFVSAAVAGGSPGPVAAVGAGAGGALVLARVASRTARWLVPAATVAAGAFLIVRPGAFDPGPLQGPFGYANAAGSFFALAAVAGLMVAVSGPTPWARVAGVVAALAFAAVPISRGSVAPAALLVLAPLALLSARRPAGVRVVVAAAVALFLATLLATAILGASGDPGRRPAGVTGAAESALSGRRLTLWHEALALMAEHPVTGVGPGRFAEASEVARRDRDARWAHHEFLQRGAEEGVPGLVLLVSLVLWGFWRLWTAPSPDAATALGAAALAVVAMHACVDYVFHFPAIPVAAAALLGTAQVATRARATSRTEADAAELVGA
jgi:O-antigen ligase